MHADVALDRVVAADEFDPGRVVAFGEEGGPTAPQPEVGVVVRVVGDPPVLVLDAGQVGVLHQPERRLRVGEPAVQQDGVARRVNGAQRELAEPVVEPAVPDVAHAGAPAGTPNSWKAIRSSTG